MGSGRGSSREGVWNDTGIKRERIMAQGGLNPVGKGGRGRRRGMGEKN